MSVSMQEKVFIRSILGYPALGTGPVLSLGVPTGGQMGFLVELAMDQVLPEAEPRLREILHELACIESQMSDARGRARASQTGDIKLRAREEQEDLQDQLLFWVDTLSDMLSIGPNQFSFRNRRMGGSWTVVEPG